jgi:hypothetical protein
LIAQSVEPSESEMSTLPMDIDRWLDIDDVVTLRKKQRVASKKYLHSMQKVNFIHKQ